MREINHLPIWNSVSNLFLAFFNIVNELTNSYTGYGSFSYFIWSKPWLPGQETIFFHHCTFFC